MSHLWWVAILFAWMLRLGEATHPGPEPASVYPGLQIGCINPTGLLGKSQLVKDLPRGEATIWAVSESYLSTQGRRKCIDELRFHSAGYQLHAGAPVPLRSSSVSAIGGKHRGVAFLSTMPTRTMSQTWPQEEWQQARFHMSAFSVGRRWVQGAVVYGFAAQPDSVSTKDATDRICQHVTTRLVEQSSGLRFIAGDFNQGHLAIESMEYWASKGWVNVQWWAFQKLHKLPVPTCKGVSIKDNVFVSPELAMYLENVLVDDTYFKDHSVLAARFSSLGKPPLLPLWKQPQPIEWKEVPDIQSATVRLEPKDHMDERYLHLFQQLEQCVDQQLRQAKKTPLLAKQKGRAATSEVHFKQEYSQPPKPARGGERQPEFHGVDPTHGRWLRQARRLVNLAKNLNKEVRTKQQQQHATQVWYSIVNATGFVPNFVGWWNETCGEVATLVSDLPSPKTISIVAEAFDSKLVQLEKVLNKARIATAKKRRQDDVNIIFKDLKKESPKPCTTLLHAARAQVVEANPEDQSITLEPPQAWKENQPIWTDQGPMEVIHAEPDKLWLQQDPAQLVGTQVKQDEYIGQINNMFQAFQDEWVKRWDRHLHVQESYWQPLVEFVQLAFPHSPVMEYQRNSLEQWNQALRRKKHRSAVGTDGVSRADLINMPTALKLELLDILHTIEEGNQWPSQLLQGWVIALEKQQGASEVSQYRPVTIFALAYRVWSSVRAKQILKHLSRMAPESCAGNLPTKSTCDVWYTILSSIEMAHHTGQEVSGAVIDLVKCFNLLPRMPVIMMMRQFNVPDQILQAWSKALVGMRRRFKLRTCTGPGIPSSTGFAEGCGLSVTAMLAVNLVAHKWMLLRFPSVTLYSYVDNLELLCPSADHAIRSLDELLNFTEVLDVAVDHHKTYLWSTQTVGRKVLRKAAGPHRYQVLYQARDLGGHMSYSRQHTNSTLTKRVQGMPELWNQMSRSLAPYQQKLHSLKAKAWPLGLHGIQATTMAAGFFATLRTGAVRAIREHSSGTNPMLHLGAVEHPVHDPQFHVIAATISMLRTHGPTPEAFDFVLAAHHTFNRHASSPGPCGVALNRLHVIGWQWVGHDTFLDHEGLPIGILHCPVQEVKQRLTESWQQHTMHLAQARKTFVGAPYMHPGLTVANMRRHDPEQQALLRAALNGTFFTADHLVHRQGEHSGLCRFCHEPDSQLHRHWKCPFFQSCRSHLTVDQIQAVLELPAVVANHGWVPKPPSLMEFRKQCLGLPDETADFIWPAHIEEMLFLFTDGSCMAPTSPWCRLASWGVVLGSVEHDVFQPVSNGLVQGWVQTAARAEIHAVLSAFEFVLRTRKPFALWVDNDRVYKKLQLFQRGCFRITSNQKDADLWMRLRSLYSHVGHLLQHVGKVVSHQNLRQRAGFFGAMPPPTE